MGALPESRVGFGLRLVASLLDAVFIIGGGVLIGAVFGGVLGGIFGGAMGPIEGAQGGQMSGAQAGGILGMFFGAMVGISLFGIVYMLLEAFSGATLAKMLMGLKIGDADGTKANVGKLFFRYILKNITFISSLLAGLIGVALIRQVGGILGVVWFLGCFLALTQSRRALHDYIAGTAVYPRKVLKES